MANHDPGANFVPLGNRRRKASMTSLSPPPQRKMQKIERNEPETAESSWRAQENASVGAQSTGYFRSSERGMNSNYIEIHGDKMSTALEALEGQKAAALEEIKQNNEAIRQNTLKKMELRNQRSLLIQSLKHRKATLEDNQKFLEFKRVFKEENERLTNLKGAMGESCLKFSVVDAQLRRALETEKESRRRLSVVDARARLIDAQEELQKAEEEAAAAAEMSHVSGSIMASNLSTGNNLEDDSAREPQATRKNKKVKSKKKREKDKRNRGLLPEDPMSWEDYERAIDIKLEQYEDSGYIRSFPEKGATQAGSGQSLEQLEMPRITLANEPRDAAEHEEVKGEEKIRIGRSRRSFYSRRTPILLEPRMTVQQFAEMASASEFRNQNSWPQQSSTSVGFSSYAGEGFQPFGDRGHKIKSELPTRFSGFSRNPQGFGPRDGEEDLRQVDRSGGFHRSTTSSPQDSEGVVQNHFHQNQTFSAHYLSHSTQGSPVWGRRGTPESARGNIGVGSTSYREHHDSSSERPNFLGSYAITRDPVPPHTIELPEAKGREGKSRRKASPLPKPIPTHQYMAQAQVPPKCAEEANDLLIVIDLNGTLLYRPVRKQPKRYVARPCVEKFLYYITKTHNVVVWSSARLSNVEAMCDKLFKQHDCSSLITVWGRDKFKLTNQQYNAKIQVYKDLEHVWKDPKIASRHPGAAVGKIWNQSNTVLIDDSIEKGSAQPYNILEIPEFNGKETKRESPLQAVTGYLENLRWQEDVSAYMREKPFKVDPKWELGWMVKEKLPDYLVAPPSIDVPDREPSMSSSKAED